MQLEATERALLQMVLGNLIEMAAFSIKHGTKNAAISIEICRIRTRTQFSPRLGRDCVCKLMNELINELMNKCRTETNGLCNKHDGFRNSTKHDERFRKNAGLCRKLMDFFT